ERQQRAVGYNGAARLYGIEPIRNGEPPRDPGIDARKIVHEPVRAGADRQAQADVEKAIVAIRKSAGAAAVEDIQGIEPTGQDIRRRFVAAGVVAPDDRAALFAGIVNAGTQRRIVKARAGNARSKADRLGKLLDIQQHHVAISLAVRFEVVAVLLAIV